MDLSVSAVIGNADLAGPGRFTHHEIFSELHGASLALARCFPLLCFMGWRGNVTHRISRKYSLEHDCCIVKTLDII